VVQILRQEWERDEINHEGEVYQFKGVPTAPAKPYHSKTAARFCISGAIRPPRWSCAQRNATST